jgi:glutamate racemase
MAVAPPLTVEVIVRITAEVSVIATSHPAAHDAVDDLIATLQVADKVEIVASRALPPYAEPGIPPTTQEDTHG